MSNTKIKNDYINNSVIPDRCLARIVAVDDLTPIEGALNIELAHVLGWQCVVRKNEFKIGDLAIYLAIDSVLDPQYKNFSFLEGKRLKTKKILNTLSQGLLGPLSWLSDYNESIDIKTIKLDDDVTTFLNVRKFVMTTELKQYMDSIDADKKFPTFCPKTDEERVQNIPKILQEIVDKEIIITRKEDGTSTTYIYCKKKTSIDNFVNESINDSINDSTDIFLICGRNRILTKKNTIDYISGTHYFTMAEKFDIETKMRNLGINICIQGEIVGPKINGNKLKLNYFDFRVFNIWDIDSQRYLLWERVMEITNILGLNCVPLIYKGPFKAEWSSVKKLLSMADDIEYAKDIPAEGMVVKTNDDNFPRHSFKVISNKYLLKNN